MTTADNGGFDFAVEIAEDTVTFAARSLVIPPSAPQPFNGAGMQGRILPHVAIDDIDLIAPTTLRMKLNLQGTNILVTQIVLGGVGQSVPAWMQNIELSGIVTIDDRLEILGNALVVNYIGDPAAGTPHVDFALDESSVLASPLVTLIMAQAILEDPTGTTYQQRRTQILDMIRLQTITAVRSQIMSLGTQTLIPSPPPFPPPIPSVISANFKIGDRTIHMLYHTCGSGGNPALITRSNLLRRTSDGQPLDVATLIASNTGFIGCVVNPATTMALGLSPGGFVAGHPFLWIGRIPLPIVGGPPPLISGVFVTSILAGIDGTNLRLLANLVADGVGGAFTINAAVDTTFSLTTTATATGTTLTMTTTPLGLPIVQSDVSIAWWVYASSFLSGGIELATVLAAIDAFGGLVLNGVIATAVARFLPTLTLPLSLPPAIPAVTVRTQSLRQADAPTRTVTIVSALGISVPFTDPFPANDIIINLV
jgi:hypothetical protein